MKSSFLIIILVQCLLLSKNIVQCLVKNCGIEGEICELENVGDIGKCKLISQCESAVVVQNTTNNAENTDVLGCCNHVRHTRAATRRTRKIPKRRGYIYERNKKKFKETPTELAVVGGVEVNKGEFPFMAALGWPSTAGGYDYRCGGFFVTGVFVITAGHCARSRGIQPVVVRPGGGRLDENDNPTLSISSILVHPFYKQKGISQKQNYNDIAIIKTSPNSPHTPANLWRSPTINFPNAVAIGYGHTKFAGKSSNVLRKVTLSLFSNSFCSRFYPPDPKLEKGIVSSQLCAGEIRQARDVCQGDSGGPLVVKVNSVSYVIGLTSFGTGCAGGIPSVFTRISSYVPWIESVIT